MNCQPLQIGLASLVIACPAVADTTEIVADRDNTLFGPVFEDLASGIGDSIYAGRTADPALPNNIRRAVIHFDVSSIPAGATITSASVGLRVTKVPPLPPSDVAFSLHRCLGDWGEGPSNSAGGAGAGAQTGDATWFFRVFPTEFWDNLGGDFEAAVSGSATVNGVGAYSMTGAGLAADVQAWVDGESNHGWVLIGDVSVRKTVREFASRENLEPAFRPTLTVEWEVSGPAGDLNGDGVVNGADLGLLLANWGSCAGCASDLNGDDVVNGADLGLLLVGWD